MNKHYDRNNLISKWLNGTLSQEEVKQLEASGELDDLKHVLDDIATWKLPDFDVRKGLNDLERRKTISKKSETKVVSFHSFLRYAAVVTLLIATYFGWDTFLRSDEIRIATTVGETIRHEFPDGSIAELDAVSEIIYNADEWGNKRDIALKGQAFFKVNKGKQFTVNTPLGSIQVLGTQFNVLADDSTLTVKCFEGKVSVKTETQNTELSQGMGVSKGSDRMNRFVVAGSEPDWMDGFTVYDKALLSRVVEDLKRYYDVKIKLPEKYSKLKFSGKVPHNDLKLALKTIFVPMEIHYTLNRDNEVVFD